MLIATALVCFGLKEALGPEGEEATLTRLPLLGDKEAGDMEVGGAPTPRAPSSRAQAGEPGSAPPRPYSIPRGCVAYWRTCLTLPCVVCARLCAGPRGGPARKGVAHRSGSVVQLLDPVGPSRDGEGLARGHRVHQMRGEGGSGLGTPAHSSTATATGTA
jgi:hypothetical protein